MRIFEKIYRSNFLIKLRSWEYWPFGIVHFPVIVYYLWLAIRARALTFFSASNPGILMGGMFGESKYDVLKKIPTQYLPFTILITVPSTPAAVIALIGKHNLSFPLIFKPDIGERGFMVSRINSKDDIIQYIHQMKFNFIIQEFVNLPVELGVFYVQYPSQLKGEVTSVVMKQMLSVTGDGRSTLKSLILRKDRAKLQWKNLEMKYQRELSSVIENGKKYELVSIGNHCLGTTFLNANHLINEPLHQVFRTISKNIEGFNFGRFDLRCASLDDLFAGKIKIMELNGCGAEPAHIYQPDASLLQAIKVLLNHWKTIYKIASEYNKRGVSYISYKDAHTHYKNFRKAVSLNPDKR